MYRFREREIRQYQKQQEAIRYQTLYDDFLKKSPIDLGFYLKSAIPRESEKQTTLLYTQVPLSANKLYNRACALQITLQQNGLKKGEKVLLFMENCFAFYAGYFAALQAGAVIIPGNTFLKDQELLHLLSDAAPRFIITNHTHRERFVTLLKPSEKKHALLCIDEMLDDVELNFKEHPAIVGRDPDELAVLMYTSGTTGVPKGVMLSSRNIITNMLQMYSRLSESFLHRQKVLAALPLFHSFTQITCIFGALYAGATVSLLPKIERLALLRTFKLDQPTVVLGVPALYGLLCLLKNVDFSATRLFISGSDALSDRIREGFALLYNRKICNGYGLSEASPVVAVDLDDYIPELGCVGTPLHGVECQIRNDLGELMQDGDVGSLFVKGDNVMLGYYNAPEQTAKALRNGWLDTGDLGYINKRGKIVIVGREKELIKHKGFNIYPQEIEIVLLSHPLIVRAAVIGEKGDHETEEYPVAYVQIHDSVEITEQKDVIIDELKSLCKQRLASYKIPREIRYSDGPLPTTPIGKVDKKLLKK